MISSILFVNLKGEILIFRNYKDNVSRAEVHSFCQRVVAAKESREKPIQHIGGCHFIYTQQGGVVLVATTKDNVNAVLVLKLLYKMVDLFRAYFGNKFDESEIKRNFVLIYELLDEIIDYGYPQILEENVLKKYITQGGSKVMEDAEQLQKITVQATGMCSWRQEGIRHKRNEVYIDVVENVNLLQSVNSDAPLSVNVSGQILVKCQLSGMPECKFGMNDKLVISGEQRPRAPDGRIALDDCRFHQCVRLSKFDVDREITFIPPEGTFELMTYRVTEHIDIPFNIKPMVKVLGRNKLEYALRVTSNFNRSITATDVVIIFPCPRNTASGHISSYGTGKAKYEAARGAGGENAVVWRIRKFEGKRESSLFAEIELASTMSDKAWVRPPVSMTFEVPQFSASGLQVRFLKVVEKQGYKPAKWIRYLTRAGTYQHRI